MAIDDSTGAVRRVQGGDARCAARGGSGVGRAALRCWRLRLPAAADRATRAVARRHCRRGGRRRPSAPLVASWLAASALLAAVCLVARVAGATLAGGRAAGAAVRAGDRAQGARASPSARASGSAWRPAPPRPPRRPRRRPSSGRGRAPDDLGWVVDDARRPTATIAPATAAGTRTRHASAPHRHADEIVDARATARAARGAGPGAGPTRAPAAPRSPRPHEPARSSSPPGTASGRSPRGTCHRAPRRGDRRRVAAVVPGERRDHRGRPRRHPPGQVLAVPATVAGASLMSALVLARAGHRRRGGVRPRRGAAPSTRDRPQRAAAPAPAGAAGRRPAAARGRGGRRARRSRCR